MGADVSARTPIWIQINKHALKKCALTTKSSIQLANVKTVSCIHIVLQQTQPIWSQETVFQIIVDPSKYCQRMEPVDHAILTSYPTLMAHLAKSSLATKRHKSMTKMEYALPVMNTTIHTSKVSIAHKTLAILILKYFYWVALVRSASTLILMPPVSNASQTTAELRMARSLWQMEDASSAHTISILTKLGECARMESVMLPGRSIKTILALIAMSTSMPTLQIVFKSSAITKSK